MSSVAVHWSIQILWNSVAELLMVKSFRTGYGALPGLADGFCRSFAGRGSAFQSGLSFPESLNLRVDRLDDFGRIHDPDYTSATPEPKNPLPTLREKFASFEEPLALMTTPAACKPHATPSTRHTAYLWVRQNRIPYFRLNAA
jgi:hypothetical protein